MSSRNLTPELLDLIARKKVLPALFVFADFPSGPQRVWTGIGDYFLTVEEDSNDTNDSNFDSNYIDEISGTYQGVGGMISFETMAETTDTAAKGISVRVSGLDPNFASKLVSDDYQGRRAIIYQGYWNPDTGLLALPPEPWWRGFLDTDEFTDARDKADLIINCGHRIADILRKREYRYTHKDQQALYPGYGDLCFSGMEQIQDKIQPWGKAQT